MAQWDPYGAGAPTSGGPHFGAPTSNGMDRGTPAAGARPQGGAPQNGTMSPLGAGTTPLLAAGISVLGSALLLILGANMTLLMGVVALCVALFGIGWGYLVGAPSPTTTSAVVTVSGLSGVAMMYPRNLPLNGLQLLISAIALSVMVAFVHEILRGKDRDRVTESVTLTVAGQVIALIGSGWLLLAQQSSGPDLSAIALVSLSVTMIARVVGRMVVSGALLAWLAAGAGALAGVAALMVITLTGAAPPTPAAAAVIGAAVGGCSHALARLLESGPGSRNPLSLATVALAPVLIAGVVASSAFDLMRGR